MLSPEFFFNLFLKKGTGFFAGVPDSSLKHFCAYITEHVSIKNHFICANEGNAVSLAAGHYLASGQIPVVYMQNSGIGNAVNPLLSILDPDVYSIPVLLLVGWRGEPGKKDEPQHKKQGRVLLEMLEAMEIPYKIIDGSKDNAKNSIDAAYEYMEKKNAPFSLVVKTESFESYKIKKITAREYPLVRETAVKLIIDSIDTDDIVVSTTGMTSREVFEYREALGHGHEKDFLIVGGMGHASQVALGIALKEPDRKIFCLDGDGAAIMHMGSIAINGISGCENLFHIVLNNGAHDSVGGQPTVGHKIDFIRIAEACRYKTFSSVEKKGEITACLKKIMGDPGPHFLEIRLNKGNRKGIGRPTTSPVDNKKAFMRFVRKK
jgi:phosphonopyruvate decarboxylase